MSIFRPSFSKFRFGVKIFEFGQKTSRLGHKCLFRGKFSKIWTWGQYCPKCQCWFCSVEIVEFGPKLSKMSMLGLKSRKCWSWVKIIENVELKTTLSKQSILDQNIWNVHVCQFFENLDFGHKFSNMSIFGGRCRKCQSLLS